MREQVERPCMSTGWVSPEDHRRAIARDISGGSAWLSSASKRNAKGLLLMAAGCALIMRSGRRGDPTRERLLPVALTGLAVGVAVAAAFSVTQAEDQTCATARADAGFGAEADKHGAEGRPEVGEAHATSGVAEALTPLVGAAGAASHGDVLNEADLARSRSDTFKEPASTSRMTAMEQGVDREEQ